jgi:hypothetical protein
MGGLQIHEHLRRDRPCFRCSLGSHQLHQLGAYLFMGHTHQALALLQGLIGELGEGVSHGAEPVRSKDPIPADPMQHRDPWWPGARLCLPEPRSRLMEHPLIP